MFAGVDENRKRSLSPVYEMVETCMNYVQKLYEKMTTKGEILKMFHTENCGE